MLPAKSTKHRVQNQLGSNGAFSQFVSLSPSHLFVFLSRSLSLGLWSPAVLDSLSALKSSLALLACQAADGTNAYLRFCAPLPPPTSTSFLIQTNLLLLPKTFPPTALNSLFLSVSLHPPVLHLLLSPCRCQPSCLFPPPLLAGYLGTGEDCA